MKRTSYIVENIETLLEVACQFLDDWGDERLFALEGQMGAGKTTFVKAICKALEVVDVVSSPTFSIVNEYTTSAGEMLYHFDFYRIDNEQEALDFGVEEYWDSGAMCFMEWSEKVSSLLPDTVLEVKIEEIIDGKRQITVSNYDN